MPIMSGRNRRSDRVRARPSAALRSAAPRPAVPGEHRLVDRLLAPGHRGAGHVEPGVHREHRRAADRAWAPCPAAATRTVVRRRCRGRSRSPRLPPERRLSRTAGVSAGESTATQDRASATTRSAQRMRTSRSWTRAPSCSASSSATAGSGKTRSTRRTISHLEPAAGPGGQGVGQRVGGAHEARQAVELGPGRWASHRVGPDRRVGMSGFQRARAAGESVAGTDIEPSRVAERTCETAADSTAWIPPPSRDAATAAASTRPPGQPAGGALVAAAVAADAARGGGAAGWPRWSCSDRTRRAGCGYTAPAARW